jgi:dipeptidyl aminopeptidase/acylaminoacyl peptidase
MMPASNISSRLSTAAATMALAHGLTGSAVAQTLRRLEPADVFQVRTIGDPRVSPDGNWIAYTVTSLDREDDASRTDIYMVSASGGEPVRLTNSKLSATSPRWSPDGRYLAFLSGRDGKMPQVYLLDRRGGDAQRLTDYQAGASAIAWSPDSRKIALLVADPNPDDTTDEALPASRAPARVRPIVITRLQFMKDGSGYLSDAPHHLYVFDVATKTDLQITTDRWDDGAPVWSPDGKVIAFSANRTDTPDANQNNDIFVVEPRSGAVPQALTTSPGSDTAPVFSPDGKSIAYVAGGDPQDIWYGTNNIAIVPVAGGPPRILTHGLDRNVSRPRFTASGGDVLFLVEEGGDSHLARANVETGTVTRVLDGSCEVTAFDVADTGDIAVLDSIADRPGELSLLKPGVPDHGAVAVSRLTHVNDEFLSTVTLGRVERFTAASADGTPVDAFLTLPPGVSPGKKLPTILSVHGGPAIQFSSGFNLEWQMLAAHGFAVVAANPRGSSGYGRAFSRAIWADWGNKDYDDVMAVVDRAIATGVADPDRLGVGGWSYGGVLTDHIIAKTTRFKAAISGASEFNYLADYGTDQYQRQWEAELGLPWEHPDLWMKLSPFYRVDRIVTPTLVLGGDADMSVPISGGEQLYQALKRLGRDTELVIYPHESHAIRRPSFQQDRLERYLAWYDHYVK